MRVVATAHLPVDLTGQLAAALGAVEVWAPPAGHCGLAEPSIDDRLQTTDALVCLLLDRIDAAWLARAPNLRIVATCSVGVDHVDVAAATAAGVAIAHTPDVLTEATAEFAFALLLAAARRVGEGERLIRDGHWQGWQLDQLLGIELHGKTAGVVGLGRIGRAFARRALGFGMRVIYSDPDTQPLAGAEQVDLDTLFATADAISLHCPLTPQTTHLVDARRIASMKPTAILVNTARGGCVDETALAAALATGRIGGAGLDVYAREPASAIALRDCPRLVLAPHLGSATTETRTAMAQLCVDAVIDALSRRQPRHLVNPEVWPQVWQRGGTGG